MFCKQCGTQLSENTAFCNKCGAAQDVQAAPQNVQPQQQLQLEYCEHCGAEIMEGSVFCKKCGKQQMKPAAPEKASPPPKHSPGPVSGYTAAPGKMLIKVTGILFVVVVGLGLLSLTFLAVMDELDYGAFHMIVIIASGINSLYVGIMAIKHCDAPSKARMLQGLFYGKIVFAIGGAFVSLYDDEIIMTVIGIILEAVTIALFIWGVRKNIAVSNEDAGT